MYASVMYASVAVNLARGYAITRARFTATDAYMTDAYMSIDEL
jgi:hypothetical protein